MGVAAYGFADGYVGAGPDEHRPHARRAEAVGGRGESLAVRRRGSPGDHARPLLVVDRRWSHAVQRFSEPYNRGSTPATAPFRGRAGCKIDR
jgi:hypothetical protein